MEEEFDHPFFAATKGCYYELQLQKNPYLDEEMVINTVLHFLPEDKESVTPYYLKKQLKKVAAQLLDGNDLIFA